MDSDDESLAELGVPGFDDDLAGEATRIRNLLTGSHPAPERVLGPRVADQPVLDIPA